MAWQLLLCKKQMFNNLETVINESIDIKKRQVIVIEISLLNRDKQHVE